MHRAGADTRVLDLRHEPFAQVRVGTVAVIGQFVEERPDLADPLPTLLADQSTFRHLRKRPMRHRHHMNSFHRRGSLAARVGEGDAARAASSGYDSGTRALGLVVFALGAAFAARSIVGSRGEPSTAESTGGLGRFSRDRTGAPPPLS